MGGYPPWAYFTGALFTWPSNLVALRLYYGLVNLGLLAFLLVWAFGLGRPGGKLAALFLTASLLAVSSICWTFGLGQYGVVVLAALVGAYLLDGHDRWILAGLLVGIALTKVTLSAPFLLPFLFKRRWKTPLVALVYIGAGSLVIWPMVKTNPFEMVRQMSTAAQDYVLAGYSLINVFVKLGLETAMAMKVAWIFTVALAAAMFFLWRSAPMLTHFAIAAVAARLWTYHTHCDNLILIFLLMALGQLAVRNHNGLAWAGFIVLGLSLWPAAYLCDVAAYRVFQCATWLACLAVLLFLEPRRSDRGVPDTGELIAPPLASETRTG